MIPLDDAFKVVFYRVDVFVFIMVALTLVLLGKGAKRRASKCSFVSELSANSSIQLSKEQIILHLNYIRANFKFVFHLRSIENKLKIKTHLIFKRWFEFVVYHFLVEHFG